MTVFNTVDLAELARTRVAIARKHKMHEFCACGGQFPKRGWWHSRARCYATGLEPQPPDAPVNSRRCPASGHTSARESVLCACGQVVGIVGGKVPEHEMTAAGVVNGCNG